MAILRFLTFLILALALQLESFSTAQAKINLLQQVDKNIWRGSQPTEDKDFDQIKGMGIKVLINIQREGDKKVRIEKRKALERGFQFIHIPVDAQETPSEATIEKIFKELLKVENHPVYLHCTYGRDRTGLVFALYRVRVQGWTPEAAYKEWVGMGFKYRYLLKLDSYFKEVTGLVTEEPVVKESDVAGSDCGEALNF